MISHMHLQITPVSKAYFIEYTCTWVLNNLILNFPNTCILYINISRTELLGFEFHLPRWTCTRWCKSTFVLLHCLCSKRWTFGHSIIGFRTLVFVYFGKVARKSGWISPCQPKSLFPFTETKQTKPHWCFSMTTFCSLGHWCRQLPWLFCQFFKPIGF